jgi:hypothetical protein
LQAPGGFRNPAAGAPMSDRNYIHIAPWPMVVQCRAADHWSNRRFFGDYTTKAHHELLRQSFLASSS